MSKAKKDAKIVNFNLSVEVIEALTKYCEETGRTKTAAVERFVMRGIKEYEESKEKDKS